MLLSLIYQNFFIRFHANKSHANESIQTDADFSIKMACQGYSGSRNLGSLESRQGTSCRCIVTLDLASEVPKI